MKKFLAVLIAITLLFSCLAITASALEAPRAGAVITLSELIERIVESIRESFNNFFDNLFGRSSQPTKPVVPKPKTVVKPTLVAKNSTVTIDRENGLVYGFDANIKVSDVHNYVKVSNTSTGSLQITAVNGDYAGTGTTIKVIQKSTNAVVESFEIVIFGDLDGDADIDADDKKIVQDENFMITTWSMDDFGDDPYSACKVAAADLNKDSRIDSTDVAISRDVIDGYLKIDQVTGTVSRIPMLDSQPETAATITIDREKGIVYGFDPNIKVDDVAKYVGTSNKKVSKLEIIPINGDFAGTGTIINVVEIETGNVVESFEIVIFGDLDGDADIDSVDQDIIEDENFMITTWSIEDFGDDPYSVCKVAAADLNKDDNINSTDTCIVRDYLAGYLELDQVTGTVSRVLMLDTQPETVTTVTIDREKGIVYGFDTMLTKDDISDFVTVTNKKTGKLEIVCAKNAYSPFVGTGSKINVVNIETGEVVEAFTVIIFGDLNGDSYISSIDASIAEDEVDGTTSWSDKTSDEYSFAMAFAADINKDGVITAKDEDAISNHALGIGHIEQAA
ncbi:MAG: hypothetical protein IJF40_03890 [Clostridia bacterium]|nr:hypothetical protein [Clostridia bacterium]MBQ7046483.1 hypothetical protein [Oscillospiraceae bacterium]